MKIKESCVILLPSYNAGSFLVSLLPSIQKTAHGQKIVVVDDGSDDNTTEVLERFKVERVAHARNFGKGRAIMTGLIWARSHGYRWAVTMDADGQHSPDDLARFLDAPAQPESRLILGVRKILGTAMPAHRRFSNWLTSRCISLLAGKSISDCQSGYRAYPTRLIDYTQITKSGRFEWEARVLVELSRLRYVIEEVPISTVYAHSQSHIRLIADTARFVAMTGGLLLRRPQGAEPGSQ